MSIKVNKEREAVEPQTGEYAARQFFSLCLDRVCLGWRAESIARGRQECETRIHS